MKNLKPFVFIVLSALLLGLFLTACGGGEEPTPVPAPTATDVPPTTAPEPTDVPAPTEEPTAVPEPTDEPEPTEEPAASLTDLTSTEGGFSLQYPADWFAADLFGFTILASDEDLLDEAEPGKEGAVVMVLSGPTDEFESDDPLAALNMAIDESIAGNDMEVVDGPTAVTIQGQDAAVATVKATADDGTLQTGYMALIIGQGDGAGRAGIVIGMAPAEMEDEVLPIFEDIANTVVVTEVAEEEGSGQTAEGVPESQGFLLYGDNVSGEVAAGAISAWDFIGLEGEAIDIVVTPDDTLDAIVDVLDENGNSILEAGPVDDSFDTEEILGLTLPSDGTYYIVVSGFADATGTYDLSIGEAGTVGTPPAGGESGGIAFGDTVSGEVAESGAISSWNFSTAEGDLIGAVVVVSDDFDAVLDVVDATGNSILDNTRDATFGDENILIDIPADGEYAIQIMGFEDSTGSFDLTLGYPMSNSVFASAELTEDEMDVGDVYPFIAVAGDMVGIIVSPEEGLDTAVLVEQDGVVVEGIGYAPERGFDTLDGEAYVFIVPEDGVYQCVGNNSVDTEFGDNTGTYDVDLHSSGNTVFELADQDATAAITDESGFIAYAIRGLPGQTLTLEVEPYTDFDAIIALEDQESNLLQDVTDEGGVGEIETLTYTFSEDMVVFIKVYDADGVAGSVYVMTVSKE